MQILRHHADEILRRYKGDTPLAGFINNYFRQHPILGSKDRKIIAERVFTFYRISSLIEHLNEAEKTLCVDAFMAERLASKLQKNALKNSDWVENGQVLDVRIKQLQERSIAIHPTEALNRLPELSKEIDPNQYALYLLRQNAVFVKLHARFRERIIDAFHNTEIAFSEEADGLIRIASNTKLQEILKPEWYRIQDASSVETAVHFPDCSPQKVWDTCAGGGGKSLLLHEKYPDAVVHASDNRSFKLENLKSRFREHGYRQPVCFDWDGETEESTPPIGAPYDVILCDVPCSGSGTWARNPEGAYFFTPEMLQSLAKKQQSIVTQAIQHLKPEGYLVYITCSVFRDENEAMIEWINTTGALAIESQTVINGMHKQADCLFVAVLKK
jgi:16S rRNA (cytosine967-C5)-methyltransferase